MNKKQKNIKIRNIELIENGVLMCSSVQQLPRKGIFMLSYIPGKRYHFIPEECDGCPKNCDKQRCGDADRLLAEIRNAIIKFKNPHLMGLYWKIEKEVRPQNYPEYPDVLLDEIAAAVRTINVFHVDSASRKKIINYYNKIEQEVLKSNGKR